MAKKSQKIVIDGVSILLHQEDTSLIEAAAEIVQTTSSRLMTGAARRTASEVFRNPDTFFRYPSDKAMMEAAAKEMRKTPSTFIADAARTLAANIVCDQTDFVLSLCDSREMENLLENPPKPSEDLRQLMRSPAPWDCAPV